MKNVVIDIITIDIHIVLYGCDIGHYVRLSEPLRFDRLLACLLWQGRKNQIIWEGATQ